MRYANSLPEVENRLGMVLSACSLELQDACDTIVVRILDMELKEQNPKFSF